MKKLTSILLCIILLFSFVPVAFASGTAYYVDAVNGCDDNDGLSPDTAWRTLTKAADTTFSAGDRLLLKRGCVFTQFFATKGSGTADAPVTVSAYGEGSLPVIENTQAFPVFIIHSVGSWVVENLEFTAPDGTGALYIAALGDVDTENITIRNCVFHDISPDDSSTSATAISINTDESGAKVRNIHFDGLKIYNVSWGIHTNGITAENRGDIFKNPDESYNSDYLFENIEVRGAKYGGIVIAAVQDCTVRNCRVLDSATALIGAYAPLWMRHTNRTTVEYCEIAGSTNPRDGMAIDFDGWTTNSTYRYIYSHDNNRFMRNCVFDAKTKNAGNSVYNCVSVNDKGGISHSATMLVSTHSPSLSRMADFSFHDNVLVGSKPVFWAGTPSPEVYNVTFSGGVLHGFLQRLFNLFIKGESFSYANVGDAELSSLIAEITAGLPE